MDGHFPGAGLEYLAFDPQDVPDIIGLKGRIGFFPHIVPAHIDLDASLIVQQVGKAGLAHDPLGHHPACQGYFLAFQGVVVFHHVPAIATLVVPNLDKGVLACLLQRLELVPPDLQ